MSIESAITVLVVADSQCSEAAALLDHEAVTGRVVAPDEAADALDHTTDCLVTCLPSLPTLAVTAATRESVPVVACPSLGDADTGGSLFDRVRETIADRHDSGRITSLHAGSAELVALTDEDALYEHTVSIASETLGFDTTVVFARDDDGFRRVAAEPAADVPARLDPDHGLTAEVHETGDSVLIEDAQDHPVAASGHPYRSGITVRLNERHVFEGLSTEPYRYDERDLELAELLCDHAAQAAARIRAERGLQERERTVTELHRAAPLLINAEDEAELYEMTVDIADRVLSFDRSYLLLADGDEFVSVAGTDDDIADRAPNQGVLGETYERGESFLIGDAQKNTTARPAHETTRGAISVPFGDDGVFQALAESTAAFTETDLELAELLITYASAAHERIRSVAALRESRQLIERLHAAATELAAAESEAELFRHTITAAEEVLSFDQSSLLIRDGEYLVPVAIASGVIEEGSRAMHISEGAAGKTARTGEPMLTQNTAQDDDAEPLHPEYRAGISVPIGDLGVFQAVAAEQGAFDRTDLELAELLMAHVAVSLERVRTDEALRAERDRFEALFKNIPGAAIAYEMVDGAPEVRRVNEAFERTFGYSAETVVDEKLDDYIVPPDEHDTAREYNERLEQGERIQTEVEREAADGLRHFLLQVIPQEVGSENTSGYAIYSDVTERKRREEELRRQNERLDQFASVVSHDLRNPLNVANGYLQLAREAGADAHFDRVDNALDRMDVLITDLLALARQGRDVGETEPVGVDEVAYRAWANVSTTGGQLEVATEETVDADADRLVELFENLFRNAIEHGTDGDLGAGNADESGDDEQPTITVGDRWEGDDWAGFYVADDGVGIDADFDPFEAGATTSEDGTGFGLSIVKSVAEAHGWSVEACESEDGGARFDFSV